MIKNILKVVFKESQIFCRNLRYYKQKRNESSLQRITAFIWTNT